MSEASFDVYAASYDADFTNTEIGLLQRKVVMNRLQPLLSPSIQVLEINCGTGQDAYHLSPKVKTYLATDISENMISLCRNNPESQKHRQLKFEKIGIQQLDMELQEVDLLFSNFGGLNCLSPEEFQSFAQACKIRMKKESELFFVIMGRACLWEQIYFILKAKFQKAFRRTRRNGIETFIGTSRFTTWYYTPREVKKLFTPHFKSLRKGPVAFFVPPSYLSPFFKRHPRLLRLLAVMDKVFTNFRFLANFGDHYYLHLKKRT